MGEMILEVGELHGPREPSRRPWRVRDPADVGLVGLARERGLAVAGGGGGAEGGGRGADLQPAVLGRLPGCCAGAWT